LPSSAGPSSGADPAETGVYGPSVCGNSNRLVHRNRFGGVVRWRAARRSRNPFLRRSSRVGPSSGPLPGRTRVLQQASFPEMTRAESVRCDKMFVIASQGWRGKPGPACGYCPAQARWGRPFFLREVGPSRKGLHRPIRTRSPPCHRYWSSGMRSWVHLVGGTGPRMSIPP